MASCVRNICAKNRCNPLILFKVTIDNIGVPFLRHSVQRSDLFWHKADHNKQKQQHMLNYCITKSYTIQLKYEFEVDISIPS